MWEGEEFSSNYEFLYCWWDRSCVSVMPGIKSLAVPNKHQAAPKAGFALQMLSGLLPPVVSNTPMVLLPLSEFPRLREVNYSGVVCPTTSSVFSAIKPLPEIPHPPVSDCRPLI